MHKFCFQLLKGRFFVPGKMASEAKLMYNFVRNKLHYGELEGLQSTLYKIPPSLREFQDCGIKTWYFKGQTSDKICKYE